MVREFRGYKDSQETKITTDYRVGLGRASSITSFLALPLSRLNNSTVVYPPGATHFDRIRPISPDNVNNGDTAILSHRGRPTIVHEGPIYDFSIKVGDDPVVDSEAKFDYRYAFSSLINSLLIPRISRLFSGRSIRLKHDVAVLITDETLHKQSGQLYKASHPPVFVKAFIETVASDEI